MSEKEPTLHERRSDEAFMCEGCNFDFGRPDKLKPYMRGNTKEEIFDDLCDLCSGTMYSSGHSSNGRTMAYIGNAIIEAMLTESARMACRSCSDRGYHTFAGVRKACSDCNEGGRFDHE